MPVYSSSVVATALKSILANHGRQGAEANIQSDVKNLVLFGGLSLDDDDVVLESPAPNRKRIDVEVGATVIEIKRDLSTTGMEASIEQLENYVRSRVDEHGGRWVGILTDGLRWHAFRVAERDGAFEPFAETTVESVSDADGLLIWLDGIMATAQDIPPTAGNIEIRLGAESTQTILDLADLSQVFDEVRDQPDVEIKRMLWAKLLATAFGTHLDLSSDGEDWHLFLRHTYLVVLAELVSLAAVDIEPSAYTPEEILSGRAFSDAQIGGVVEEDFFDWVTTSKLGKSWVRRLSKRVLRFRWIDVEHDVLKFLYQSVIDAETRHRLGEYYTPDWLARSIVDEVVADPLTQRVLDPGCGSGTFLYWSVKKALDACESSGMSSGEAISSVTSRVYGLDVHPVAVTLARATYLLAIGLNRLQSDRPQFNVPVYLGDSVQFGGPGSDELLSAGMLEVSTKADLGTGGQHQLIPAELRFPDRVVFDNRFDMLVKEMADRATSRAPRSSIPSLVGRYDFYGVHPDDRPVLDETFSEMCALSDDNRDHIWGYFVTNIARPKVLASMENRVDCLVGNPPWLSYRYMVPTMQEDFKELSKQRSLWVGGQLSTHQDLSALFVARTIEQYLKVGGQFGFVMPYSTLARPHYERFRSGRWTSDRAPFPPERTYAAFATPWDLDEVEPPIFPVPASVVFGARVDVEEHQSMPGTRVRISGNQPSDASFGDLIAEEEPLVFAPSTDDLDAWSHYRGRFRQGATVVPRRLVVVERAGHAPLGTAEGIASMRSADITAKHPWSQVPPLSGTVEERFLFKVHMGTTLLPFAMQEPFEVVLPIINGELQEAGSDSWPHLSNWWRLATEYWEQHRSASMSDRTLGDRIDYHSGLSAQVDSLDALRVVYNTSGSILAGAVVAQPRTVIDHKLYWCTANSMQEARFLEGVLNAPLMTRLTNPIQGKGQFGERDFHLWPWAVPVPPFDPSDLKHLALAEIASEAAELVANADTDGYFVSVRQRIRGLLQEADLLTALDEALQDVIDGTG